MNELIHKIEPVYRRIIRSRFIFCILFITCVFDVCIDYVMRPIWYDEALTIQEFASLPSYTDIYKCYVIPNNHICYTLLLRAWNDFTLLFFRFSVFGFRILSVFIACVTVLSMYLLWRRTVTSAPAIIVVICFIFNISFPIYATAVRGYMLSCLTAVVLIYLTHKYIVEGDKKYFILFFPISLISSGIMPSMLLFQFAALIHEVSAVTNFKKQSMRLFRLGIGAVAVFFLFYLPIFPMLIRNTQLKEGWDEALYAIVHFYGALGISMNFVLVAGLTGIIIKLYGLSKKRNFSLLLIQAIGFIFPFCIPAVLFLIRQPSPFPRVFFVFWILYLYIFAKGLKTLLGYLLKQFSGQSKNIYLGWSLIIFIAVNIGSYKITSAYRDVCSRYLTLSNNQDDFIYPYFMRNFSPDTLIAFVKFFLLKENNLPLSTLTQIRRQISASIKIRRQITPESAKKVRIFISPNADPPSLLFYAKLFGVPETIFLFDRPRKKVEKQILRFLLSNKYYVYIIAGGKGDINGLKKRFDIKKTTRLVDNFEHQKLYSVKK